VLGAESFRGDYLELAEQLIGEILDAHLADRGQTDMESLARSMSGLFHMEIDASVPVLQLDGGRLERGAPLEHFKQLVSERLDQQLVMFDDLAKQAPEGQQVPTFDMIARNILLEHIDAQWKDHLLVMDHLKEGIGLQGYAGKDPKREYQSEGFTLFGEMDRRIRERAVYELFHIVVRIPTQDELRARRAAEEARRRQLEFALREQHESSMAEEAERTVVRKGDKVGRNDPCPCGSGRKFKKCHGVNAA
jgi:preprotein translocase subunit SecA